MKDIFRKLMRQEIRFKHHLQQAHTRFFQKFFKQKRAMFIEESAPIAGGKLAPRPVPPGAVNNKGELLNRQLDPFSAKMQVMVAEKRQELDKFIRTEKKKRKKRAMAEGSVHFGDEISPTVSFDANASPDIPTVKKRSSTLTIQATDLPAKGIPSPKKESEGFNFQLLSKSVAIDGRAVSPENIKKGEPDFTKGKSNSEMLNAIRASLKNDFKVFKDQISDSGFVSRTAEMIKFEIHQQAVRLLLDGDISTGLKQFEFTKLMHNQEIVDDLAFKIYERDTKRIRDLQHFKNTLKFCEKGLFIKFRNGKLTYDQLLARVEESRFGTKYTVLDDMIPDLKPEYLNKPEDETMYDQYMEILREIMEREKKKAHQSSLLNPKQSEFEKEEANVPVGKHCVRSLYSVQNKKKNLAIASMIVDKAMRDSHNREVLEKKEDLFDEKQEQMERKYMETEKKINNIKSQKAKLERNKSTPLSPKKKLAHHDEVKMRSKIFDRRLKVSLNTLYSKQERDKKRIESQGCRTSSAPSNVISGDNIIHKTKKDEEREQRRENMQQVMFIDRLISDGYNVLSDRRFKMMDNLKDKMASNIQDAMQERMDSLKYPNRLQQQRKEIQKKSQIASQQSGHASIVASLSLLTTLGMKKKMSQLADPKTPEKSPCKTPVKFSADATLAKSIDQSEALEGSKIKAKDFKLHKRQSSLLKYRSSTHSFDNTPVNNTAIKQAAADVSKDFKDWFSSAVGMPSTEYTTSININEASFQRNHLRVSSPDSTPYNHLRQPIKLVRPFTQMGDNISAFGSLSVSQNSNFNEAAKYARTSLGANSPQLDYKTKAIVNRLAKGHSPQIRGGDYSGGGNQFKAHYMLKLKDARYKDDARLEALKEENLTHNSRRSTHLVHTQEGGGHTPDMQEFGVREDSSVFM
ncbi:hypothetical protein FGO68_gene11142 [Halteria grandinella]|uniref:Uncharacterized protein n=1 Tax=Halteria grandinella TaxID=5974 RepID=A0A8J8T8F9_HALGN|nr:hypothetical protein FGO68_gene11142 [Halteria grandinella]